MSIIPSGSDCSLDTIKIGSQHRVVSGESYFNVTSFSTNPE